MSGRLDANSGEGGGSVLADRLWLVPTELERQRLQQIWGSRWSAPPPPWRLCGFGPISAGIVTSRLLAARELAGRPVSEVVLVGIGGSYDLSQARLGAAVEIGSIATDMVGAELPVGGHADMPPAQPGAEAGQSGLGPWQLPSELGFPQMPQTWLAAAAALDGRTGLAPEGGTGHEVQIEIEVDVEPGSGASSTEPIFESLVLPGSTGAKLLTVGIASGSEATAAGRRARFPGVLVEDMEGFAVALACRQFGVGCRIWRGISNAVGDRRVGGWRIDDALQAVVERLVDSVCRELR